MGILEQVVLLLYTEFAFSATVFPLPIGQPYFIELLHNGVLQFKYINIQYDSGLFAVRAVRVAVQTRR